jgi:hypothetical protein
MSAATTPHQDSAPRGWIHHIPAAFFERQDLEPNLERLALRLEGLARDKPWCLTSNEQLRDLMDCSKNTLAATLIRGESLGWFRRVLIPGRHGRATGRLGIVLFVRPTDRPVATPRTFDQVAEQMRAVIRRGSARPRPRTLPFPDPIPRASATAGPQELGTSVPRNWAPSVPKNWGLTPYSKEVTEKETGTTTTATGAAGEPAEIPIFPESSSSPPDPRPEPEVGQPRVETIRDVPTLRAPAAGAPTQSIVPPPAPIESPPAAAAPVAIDLPAELMAAASEAIPGASRECAGSLLRSCGEYGLDLALLVMAWVKLKRPDKPARYARVALGGWLTKLRGGELTLEDVRGEVHGRTGQRASPRPFDPTICLARMACSGWELVVIGPDWVKWSEIPGRSASMWKHIPGDLREEIEAHKAELKAYVLSRESERGKAVALRA